VVESKGVSSSGEKGTFSTDISDDVIAEALKSVERREKPAVDAPGAATPPVANPGAEPSAVEVEVSPQGDPRDAELATLKAELELSQRSGRELMAKLKDEHEKMLRAAADLENYKRRAQKEKDEVQRFGIEKLLKDFLPVYDNFDRALEHAKDPADFGSLRTGVEMIRKLMEDTLGRHGVKTFSAKGKPFDPGQHEAMTAAETNELPPNHVFAEVLKGFTLNDRLVRPALVVVSRAVAVAAPAEAPAPGAAAPDSDDDGSGGQGA
jgi:molecular chaperone GrpE